jgi:hypothetical protein
MGRGCPRLWVCVECAALRAKSTIRHRKAAHSTLTEAARWGTAKVWSQAWPTRADRLRPGRLSSGFRQTPAIAGADSVSWRHGPHLAVGVGPARAEVFVGVLRDRCADSHADLPADGRGGRRIRGIESLRRGHRAHRRHAPGLHLRDGPVRPRGLPIGRAVGRRSARGQVGGTAGDLHLGATHQHPHCVDQRGLRRTAAGGGRDDLGCLRVAPGRVRGRGRRDRLRRPGDLHAQLHRGGRTPRAGGTGRRRQHRRHPSEEPPHLRDVVESDRAGRGIHVRHRRGACSRSRSTSTTPCCPS